MFNKFELTMMRNLLIKEMGKEWLKREEEGLAEDVIKAQLGGMFDLLVKLNTELV